MGRLHGAPDPSLRRLVMKLIAHRGWSAGEDENTLAAFARAARDDRIAGVEFDVCHAVDAMTLVVSHDPPLHIENTLTLDAARATHRSIRF
jgi:glycerophosphoryl diester phosphodiesterase